MERILPTKANTKTSFKVAIYIGVTLFGFWFILNTEPEIEMEDNLKFHQETIQKLDSINTKVQTLENTLK